MAQFSFPTSFRPEIGIAEIPVYYRGGVVAHGVLLKEGIFSYQLMDSDLTRLVQNGDACIVVRETAGHYFAEISNQIKNSSSSMG